MARRSAFRAGMAMNGTAYLAKNGQADGADEAHVNWILQRTPQVTVKPHASLHKSAKARAVSLAVPSVLLSATILLVRCAMTRSLPAMTSSFMSDDAALKGSDQQWS